MRIIICGLQATPKVLESVNSQGLVRIILRDSADSTNYRVVSNQPSINRLTKEFTLFFDDVLSSLGLGTSISASDLSKPITHNQLVQLLLFGRAHNTAKTLLVQCQLGKSRSPAAALALLGILHPQQDGDELVARVVAALADSANAGFRDIHGPNGLNTVRPNARILALADKYLSREDSSSRSLLLAAGRVWDIAEDGRLVKRLLAKEMQ